MKNATHALVSDDDGHHYVIPRDKETEFEMWLTAVTAYWSPYSRSQHQGEVPDKPMWADEVGGSPSLVEFHAEGYSIGRERRA